MGVLDWYRSERVESDGPFDCERSEVKAMLKLTAIVNVDSYIEDMNDEKAKVGKVSLSPGKSDFSCERRKFRAANFRCVSSSSCHDRATSTLAKRFGKAAYNTTGQQRKSTWTDDIYLRPQFVRNKSLLVPHLYDQYEASFNVQSVYSTLERTVDPRIGSHWNDEVG